MLGEGNGGKPLSIEAKLDFSMSLLSMELGVIKNRLFLLSKELVQYHLGYRLLINKDIDARPIGYL